MKNIWFLMLLLGLGFSNCSFTALDSNGPVGTCSNAPIDTDYCFEYSGSGWTESLGINDCSSINGTFTAGATCPTVNLTAQCTFYQGEAKEGIGYYYSPTHSSTLDMSMIRANCTANGGIFQ